MADDPPRSRAARAAAERALIRVVHHYGARPEFVLLGGLAPDLLCAGSGFTHSGTTDVDVQVNLEIAAGAVNAARLDQALRNAEFEPDADWVWRWRADHGPAVVKFELLVDLDTERAGTTIMFDGCDALSAANLRGTGFANDAGGVEHPGDERLRRNARATGQEIPTSGGVQAVDRVGVEVAFEPVWAVDTAARVVE